MQTFLAINNLLMGCFLLSVLLFGAGRLQRQVERGKCTPEQAARIWRVMRPLSALGSGCSFAAAGLSFFGPWR